jgi:hypothetical protein
MRLITVVLSLALLINFKAFAGAISAGGLQAPARYECLLVDPANPFEPFNFIVYDFPGRNTASLIKVDLRTTMFISNQSFDDLQVSTTSSGLTFSGTDSRVELEILVETDLSRPLTFQQYRNSFRSLLDLPRVEFVKNIVAYRSSLSVLGQSFQGICAKEYMVFYRIDESGGKLRVKESM